MSGEVILEQQEAADNNDPMKEMFAALDSPQESSDEFGTDETGEETSESDEEVKTSESALKTEEVDDEKKEDEKPDVDPRDTEIAELRRLSRDMRRKLAMLEAKANSKAETKKLLLLLLSLHILKS